MSNAATTATTQAGVSTWTVDSAHTYAGFAVRHMMITTVRGKFSGVAGTLQLDEADPTRSSIELEIDVSTVDTGAAQRDEHLRSADFFDVANHPKMLFRSTKVERDGDAWRVTGDLTIRGVTREVVLSVEEEGRGQDPWGGQRIGYTASTRIDRTDFGLTWNQALEAGGVLVANDVKITVDIQVSQAA